MTASYEALATSESPWTASLDNVCECKAGAIRATVKRICILMKKRGVSERILVECFRCHGLIPCGPLDGDITTRELAKLRDKAPLPRVVELIEDELKERYTVDLEQRFRDKWMVGSEVPRAAVPAAPVGAVAVADEPPKPNAMDTFIFKPTTHPKTEDDRVRVVARRVNEQPQRLMMDLWARPVVTRQRKQGYWEKQFTVEQGVI